MSATSSHRFRSIGGAVIVAVVALGLAGCVAEPTGGENAVLARESMESLRDQLLDEVGAESPDVQEGAAPCESDGQAGVDWTSHVEFDVLDMGEFERADAILSGLGYRLMYDNKGRFLASGPEGETVVLKADSLSVFTGCITE